MVSAFVRACAQLFAPRLRSIVVLSLGVAALGFASLWLGLAVLLDHSGFFAWRPLEWLVDLLGALAVLALSWLLFPAVVTLIMGCFLDRIAGVVEALDYPGRGPARRPPIAEIMFVTIRLMALTLMLNLLALPLYLLAPGINLFVFLALNGYLFGREYFEVVALRRLDMAATRRVRQRFGGRVFVGGVMIAGLFALPFVNLLAPVIATAFMVHVFEGLPLEQPQALAS